MIRPSCVAFSSDLTTIGPELVRGSNDRPRPLTSRQIRSTVLLDMSRHRAFSVKAGSEATAAGETKVASYHAIVNRPSPRFERTIRSPRSAATREMA